VRNHLRGVYLLPWVTEEGGRSLVAVDHRGRRVYEAIAYAEHDQASLAEELWRMLDRQDPLTLHLLE